MRFAILILLAASACSAQIVQSNASSNAAANTSCVFPYSVTSGNIIIAVSEWYNSASTPAVSDTRSTSFSQAVLFTAAGPVTIGVYIGTASSSGANTVTFSVSGATFQTTHCHEFLPTYMTTTVGTTSTAAFSGSPATISTSVTTSKNGEVVFGVIAGFRNASAFSPLDGTFDEVAGSNGGDSGAMEYKTAGTNGSVTVGFTNANDDQGAIVAFTLLPPAAAITIKTPSTIPDGISGTAYSFALQAVGGTGAYTWSITAGSLQSGLSLTSGVITGTPSSTGSRTITVQVTDGTLTNTKSITLGIGTSFNTPTHVQVTSNTTGPAVAMGSSVVSGNLMAVWCTTFSFSPVAISKPFDTLSTPFSFVSSVTLVGGAGTAYVHQYLFVGLLTSSGSNTVTCKQPGTSVVAIVASEISGVSALPDLRVVTLGTGVVNGTATSSTLTPTVANEIFYSLGAAFTTQPTAVSSPFTSAASAVTAREAYNVVSSTAGITDSYTLSANALGIWGIVDNTFRATATSIPVNNTTQIGAFITGP